MASQVVSGARSSREAADNRELSHRGGSARASPTRDPDRLLAWHRAQTELADQES